MVPLAIFKRTKLTHANIVAGLFHGVYVGFQFVATLYFQNVLGWSALATGMVFVFCGVAVMVLAPRFAVMAQSHSTGLMILGTGLLALGYVIWLFGLGRLDPILLIVLSQVPIGLGYAISYPSVQVAALDGIEADKSGLASGLLFSAFQIFGGIVLAFAASVFAAAPGFGWDTYLAGSAFITVLGLATLLIATMGPKTRHQPAAFGQPAE